MQQVPLKPVPAQSLSLVLDDRTVGITLRSMAGALYIWVTCAGYSVTAGQICRDRTLLTPRAAQLGLPGLDLWFADLRGTADPTFEGLGTRFLLLHGA